MFAAVIADDDQWLKSGQTRTRIDASAVASTIALTPGCLNRIRALRGKSDTHRHGSIGNSKCEIAVSGRCGHRSQPGARSRRICKDLKPVRIGLQRGVRVRVCRRFVSWQRDARRFLRPARQHTSAT